jgi:hypothetical protein
MSRTVNSATAVNLSPAGKESKGCQTAQSSPASLSSPVQLTSAKDPEDLLLSRSPIQTAALTNLNDMKDLMFPQSCTSSTETNKVQKWLMDNESWNKLTPPPARIAMRLLSAPNDETKSWLGDVRLKHGDDIIIKGVFSE